jgi:hypothetical protein
MLKSSWELQEMTHRMPRFASMVLLDGVILRERAASVTQGTKRPKVPALVSAREQHQQQQSENFAREHSRVVHATGLDSKRAQMDQHLHSLHAQPAMCFLIEWTEGVTGGPMADVRGTRVGVCSIGCCGGRALHGGARAHDQDTHDSEQFVCV